MGYVHESCAVWGKSQDDTKNLDFSKFFTKIVDFSTICNSFVGKTYIRLWGTLACASGSHLYAFVREGLCNFLDFVSFSFFVRGGIVKSSCQMGWCGYFVPHFFIIVVLVCESVG